MSLDDLKVYCDLVETGSFSRAGTLNLLTQTAVTRKLQVIEGALGCRLIERSRGRRGHQPTVEGTVFYQGCRDILDRYRELQARIDASRGEVRGTIRVETVYSVGLHELPGAVKVFMQRYPKARIHLEYNRTNRIYVSCLEGRADLGIVAYPAEQPQIAVIPISTDRLVAICAPDHELACRASVTFADLARSPFIGFEKDIPTRRAIDAHARAAGQRLEVTAEFDNIETIKRSVEVGLGVSVVPRNTVTQEVRVSTLAAVPLEPPIDRPIGVIYKRGRPFSEAMTRFVETLSAQPEPPSDQQA